MNTISTPRYAIKVNKILIVSDHDNWVNAWTCALQAMYQIEKVSKIDETVDANAIIIDTVKIDCAPDLYTFLSNKKIPFLIVGTDWSEDNQIQALVNGAAGYCNSTETAELILLAVNSVLKGDIWIQRHLVPKVIGTLIQLKSKPTPEPEKNQPIESMKRLESLSNREMDVAKMIRSGENNKTIASTLNISERTVKAHLTSIFKKLGVHDRLHLALFIKEFI